MRWGLIPVMGEGRQDRPYNLQCARRRHRYARRPSASAWKAGRRCLVIADGYYEWRETDKQPFAMALGNRGPMTFAGLWDSWRAPDGATIRSFAIITTRANELARHHPRPHAGHAAADRLAGMARRNRCDPTTSSKPCSSPTRPSA